VGVGGEAIEDLGDVLDGGEFAGTQRHSEIA
jgi:hypothetical protein